MNVTSDPGGMSSVVLIVKVGVGMTSGVVIDRSAVVVFGSFDVLIGCAVVVVVVVDIVVGVIIVIAVYIEFCCGQ